MTGGGCGRRRFRLAASATILLLLAPANLALAPKGLAPSTKRKLQNHAAYPAAASSDTEDGLPSRGRLAFLKRIITRGDIRGERYGSTNNSILSPADAALKVGVKPTREASKETWQRAWRSHRFAMKYLHHFDSVQPTDSKLALACLWWKALAGNDLRSPVYDCQLSYDLLPAGTRWIVGRTLCRFYPRLHHANVEIRTSYLDRSLCNAINSIVEESAGKERQNIRLIVMGGGYDTRSFKLLEQMLMNNRTAEHRGLLLRQRRRLGRQRLSQSTPKNAYQNLTCQFDLECYELDLPVVVEAKRKLIKSRLLRRRPWLKSFVDYPRLIEADFNDLASTRQTLESIVALDKRTHNIVVFEGVMIYLDEGVPHGILEMCAGVLEGSNSTLCFADRLENIPGGDEDAARVEMEKTGWTLDDWLSKPGLARHMGVARLNQ